jgi:pimeloyl-ACP methyl ester carboxylesterase
VSSAPYTKGAVRAAGAIAGSLNSLRRLAQGRLSALGAVDTGAVAYGSDPRHRLLTWRPRGAAPTRRVLLIHGGGFRERGPEDFVSLGPAFARAGWAADAMAYRLNDVPAAVEDTLALIDAAPPGERLATWGYSAGGLLAMLAALLRPERVSAAVVVACPGDLTAFPFLFPICPPADRARLSPARLPPAQRPPILLVQGDRDPVVPFDEARRIDARHPAVTLRRVPRGEHTLRFPVFASARARRHMRRWLAARLPENP